MSGICGLVRFDGKPVTAGVLDAMARAVPHRTTGGVGLWTEEGAGLARLAFQAEAGAREPAVERAGGLALVADARIDNREELSKLLRESGHFREDGAGDAGLVLAAYRRWGTDCAARLLGDFAFAVWDAPRRRLFAARDAMGMRPLYYRVEPGRVLFATEVKQILAVPGVAARIFEPAVAAYLTGGIGRLDWTFYDGIAQIAPAHALTLEAGRSRTWRYWDIDPEHRIRYADEDDYAAHLRELLLEAVRCRLRGDRPVGVLLSGGLDSGSVASAAGWLLRRGEEGLAPEVRAYSFAFEELTECDERHISRGIVAHYGLSATDVPADDAWPLKGFPDHGPDRDEPYTGPYQVLLDRAYDRARADGVVTLFSGDRGDLMAGEFIYDYPRLLGRGRWPTLARELALLARIRRRTFRWAVGAYLLKPIAEHGWPSGRLGTLLRPVRHLHARYRSPARSFPAWLHPRLTEEAERAWLHQRPDVPPLRGIGRRQRFAAIFAPKPMRSVIWSNRTCAAFGLRFVDPWSDRRIAEFALAVPQRVLNVTGEEKRLTRQSMKGVMPEPARLAASKVMPSALYYRGVRDRGRKTVEELLREPEAAKRAYVLPDGLRERYRRSLSGEEETGYLWYALTLEMWLRAHCR